MKLYKKVVHILVPAGEGRGEFNSLWDILETFDDDDTIEYFENQFYISTTKFGARVLPNGKYFQFDFIPVEGD